MEQGIIGLDNIESLKRKLEVVLLGRLRKKENIAEAIIIQDNLSKKSGSWDGAKEIKRWREKK